jgi:hypothetical protein
MTNVVDRRAASGRGYSYGAWPSSAGFSWESGWALSLTTIGSWLLIGIGAGFILMAFIAALGK